jgi:ABC-type uncharacterized transport system fused permease/ATPase subunit
MCAPEKNLRMIEEPAIHRTTVHRLARLALFSFVLTFLVARAAVFLIMSRRIPNMYFFLQGTHVHHLNYGIFLLTAVDGYSVFRRPTGRAADITALAYGFAVALTFDEFGMWLHLGGSYWQRASVDIVIVISALLALVGFARSLERFEKHHVWLSIVLAIALAGFGFILFSAGKQLGKTVGPTLRELELSSSP